MRATTTRPTDREGGFTLLELMAVLLILSLTFAIIVPNLEGISPTYKLRGGARDVAANIELARGESVAKQTGFAIAYHLEEGWHAVVLPAGYGPDTIGGGSDLPPEEEGFGAPSGPGAGSFGGSQPGTDEPQTPMEQREMLDRELLPTGVKFKSIVTADGEEQTSGLVYVTFDAFGIEGSHIVHLVNERDELIAVTFHALAGTISYDNEERAFEEFEGQEQEFTPAEGPQ